MEWFINKQSKIPLYLQLKDSIKYSISTGAIQNAQQLPTVHGLAKQLGVNFETVRKAYKDLEREGLLSTERGVGTFVKAHSDSNLSSELKFNSRLDPQHFLKHSIRLLLQAGKTAEQVTAMVTEVVRQMSEESEKDVVVVAECNIRQAEEISAVLKDYLRVNVQPVLLTGLSEEIARMQKQNRKVSMVITTGFHMDEVRRIIGDRLIPFDYVITNMSPETRRKLDAYPKTRRFGFICRDAEARDFYPESLKAELEIKSEIVSCLISETAKVADLLHHVDVLLAPPSVYETVKQIAPPTVPVFNVQDRVEPLSLRLLKTRVASAVAN